MEIKFTDLSYFLRIEVSFQRMRRNGSANESL